MMEQDPVPTSISSPGSTPELLPRPGFSYDPAPASAEQEMRKVKDVMTRRIVIVEASTPIQAAALIIGQSPVDLLLVSDQGQIVGAVCERNIISGALMDRDGKATIADVMFGDLLWLGEEEDLETARRQIAACKARSALVKNSEQKLVGTLLVG